MNSDTISPDITPLLYYPLLSNIIGIKLWVKHDDLYRKYGGGSKARKLEYIIQQAKKRGCNAIVTAGSAQSNHLRATAIACAQLGWKTTFIVHDVKPKITYEGNLKIIKLCGAKIRFVKKSEVALTMDRAMDDLKKEGLNPYYVWGGGHCIEGSFAYYKAVEELHSQLDYPIDYIFITSGTGTTQAGIILGCKKYLPNTNVIGISISRKKERGINEISKSIQELSNFIMYPAENTKIAFDDNYNADYESVSEELYNSIRFAAQYGLIVDPTYTGKTFYALLQYVKRGLIKKNSKVIFWHTGGLNNLFVNKDL